MNGARNRVSLCLLVYLVLQGGGVETVVVFSMAKESWTFIF
jgi:hypothetical protein